MPPATFALIPAALAILWLIGSAVLKASRHTRDDAADGVAHGDVIRIPFGRTPWELRGSVHRGSE